MNTDQPEKQWIEAYRKGDTAALGLLVEHFRRPLFAYILNMLHGRGDPEELFQEVWLRVIRSADRYREKNFAGWLFRIAHNLYIDQVRKESHPAHPLRDIVGEDGVSGIDRHPSPERGPDELAGDRDLSARIRAAVTSLPEEQREVFLMRTEGGIAFKDIARMQGTSLNTALARMRYAVEKLRPLLQEDYELLGRGT